MTFLKTHATVIVNRIPQGYFIFLSILFYNYHGGWI